MTVSYRLAVYCRPHDDKPIRVQLVLEDLDAEDMIVDEWLMTAQKAQDAATTLTAHLGHLLPEEARAELSDYLNKAAALVQGVRN